MTGPLLGIRLAKSHLIRRARDPRTPALIDKPESNVAAHPTLPDVVLPRHRPVMHADSSANRRHVRAATVETLPDVVEQKYTFAAHALTELLDWAEYALDPDASHPEGVINSLYYDTPDLLMYRQKRSSEYLKCKVRLRWYSTTPLGEGVPCYLEVKRKAGSTRHKRRSTIHVPPDSLADGLFQCNIIAAASDQAQQNGYPEHSVMLPVAHVQYRRRRYTDPGTGARIAIDWDISCPAVNTDVVPAEPPVWLPRGVLEVKAPLRHLPSSLDPLAFLLHKTSFSKYAQCLEQLMYPEGVRI